MGNIIELARLDMKPRDIYENNQWQTINMAAFVGGTSSEFSEFGIGLVSETGSCHFWGLALPQMLITAWRSMHVLDQLQQINGSTIHDAYCIGQRLPGSDVDKAIDRLSEQIPNITELRKELLKRPIPDDELDHMLTICNSPDNHINISTAELHAELAIDIIHETEQVKRAFALDETDRTERENLEARSKKPLPAEQSFQKFCKDANIQYLCDPPYGAYSIDWGHVNMKTLDKDIVYSGLRFEHPIYLACSEHSPDENTLGHVGTPVIRTNDGRELILQEARYRDDQMWVTTSVVKQGDSEAEWKLADLAALKPQMVGITFSPYAKATAEDIKRGYVLLSRASQSGLLHRFKLPNLSKLFR